MHFGHLPSKKPLQYCLIQTNYDCCICIYSCASIFYFLIKWKEILAKTLKNTIKFTFKTHSIPLLTTSFIITFLLTRFFFHSICFIIYIFFFNYHDTYFSLFYGTNVHLMQISMSRANRNKIDLKYFSLFSALLLLCYSYTYFFNMIHTNVCTCIQPALTFSTFCS